MSFLRHGQIYQSDEGQNRDRRFAPVPAIVSMSLRPAIPWRVGLHQSPPPLRRLLSMLKEVAVGVNHHLMGGGEFSTGPMGNFQPALTGPKVAAILSVVESCRRMKIPARDYMVGVLPGLADISIQQLADFTPAAWAARNRQSATPSTSLLSTLRLL